MSGRDHQKISRWANRLGLHTQPLGSGAWLVQRRKGQRLNARRIGPPEVSTHLVTDQETLQSRFPKVQRSLLDHVGVEHAAWLLRELDINCVFDVGANIGQWGKAIRRAGFRGRIVSFEPVPETAERLRQRTAHDPDWSVFACAAGDEDTTATIHTRPGTMSSLLESSDFGRAWADRLRTDEAVDVPVRRLDGLFAEALEGIDDPRIYLKMDTQGFDLPAFRGADGFLDRVLALQSEVAFVPIYEGMSRFPEMVTHYESAGFETSGIFPVTFHGRSLRAIEFDLLMVRSGAAQAARRRARTTAP